MKKSAALILIAGGFHAAMALPAWSQDKSIPDFLHSAYGGEVVIEAMAPQSDDPINRASASAEVSFSFDAEGRLEFVVLATIDGEPALRITHLLTENRDGSWADDKMTLTPDGRIEILTVDDGLAITGAGQVDPSFMTMHLRTRRLDWTGTDGDTELDLAFAFDLASEDDRHRQPEIGSACGEIVWQPRMIANPFGSSMSSVMVPVCIPR